MKNLFTFILCIFISASSFSQLSSVTPKVGLSLSDFYTGTKYSTTFKAGLLLGAAANYEYTDNISFSTELLFIQKGAKGIVTNDQEQFFTLNYISVPMSVNYSFNESVFLSGGLYAGYLMNSSTRTITQMFGGEIDSKAKNDLSESNRIDFGTSVGGGGVIDFGGIGQLVIEARYNFSLTSVMKESNPEFMPKHHTILLSLGYKFEL